jgi:predicted NBD/HSP70 family sugar kinase
MGASGRLDARAHVLKALAEGGAVSRADLVRSTSLAFSTVSAVIGDLQHEGLVTESDSRPAPGHQAMGRPSTLLSIHRRAGVVVGIEVGKQHLHAVLADLSHQVLAERHTEIAADLPAEETTTLIAKTVAEMLTESDATPAEVLGVGLGLPGPIQRGSSEVGDSSILPGWVGVKAGELAEETLGLRVLVDNDANLGALGEWMWGAGAGVANMVFLKAATGIGGGLIIDGKPYGGAGGTAGEIGHTPLEPNGPICRCGNRGCLEMVAGAQAIIASLRGTHGPDIVLEDVIALAVAGDAGCQRAIGDAGRSIGMAAAILCNVFNPHRIVLGGELAAAGELVLQPMRESLQRSALRSAAGDVAVVPGELGERAVAMGAVGLVLRSSTGMIDRQQARQPNS